MPATSKAQRRLMAACEHGADLKACPKRMTKKQMRDFATTKEAGLPEHARDRSTRGSAPFTDEELRQGYRRGGY